MNSYQMAGHAMTGKPKKGKKKLTAMHVKLAKGGAMITHEHEQHPSEDHMVHSLAGLKKHMAMHAGPMMQDSEEEADGEE